MFGFIIDLILVIVVLVGIIGAVLYFKSAKVRGRLKARGSELGNAFADGIGDVTDDRREAISSRKETNAQLESKLVDVLSAIDEAKERAEERIAEAQKFSELSKEAVEANNDEAAMSFINSQESAEDQAKTFLGTVESLETVFNDLKSKLDESKTAVKTAENETSSFEARHTALELRKQMSAASGAFGEAGSLNFDAQDDDLRSQERKLAAAEKISTTSGDKAMADFQASRAKKSRNSKLDALKKEMSKSND